MRLSLLREAVINRRPGESILVVDGRSDPSFVEPLAARLLISESLIGSVSPVPVDVDVAQVATEYQISPALNRAATLPLPCADMCLLDGDALDALGVIDSAATAGSALDVLNSIAWRMAQLGFRHVAAPGLAFGWDTTVASGRCTERWQHEYIRQLAGPSNMLLSAQSLWAETQLRPLSVVVDGACIAPDVQTGTQRVVLEIARWLDVVCPTAKVSLAVPADALQFARRQMNGTGVRVIERGPQDVLADVVYRPYQILRSREMEWCLTAGHRLIVGQLDMIGFANASYHPTNALFFLNRNLQRKLLRHADAVTFISQFGRDQAVAECPDLRSDRMHVVSCGADAQSTAGQPPVAIVAGVDRYLLCLSATFWHKNRSLAIATFAELVATASYDGTLIVAGPEPAYGSAATHEHAVIDGLAADVANRVIYLGAVSEDEKWWLLAHADAVLYPSVVEGFGLVPFEAASVGTPTLSFAGTALGEILGEGPGTIDSWVADAWATRIALWLADTTERARVVDHISTVGSHHTWRACADATWTVIDTVVGSVTTAAAAEEGTVGTHVQPTSRSLPRTVNQRMFVAKAGPAIVRRSRKLPGVATLSRIRTGQTGTETSDNRNHV